MKAEEVGFRAGRPTVQTVEKKSAFNQELHILYIDIRKAYESLSQTKL